MTLDQVFVLLYETDLTKCLLFFLSIAAILLSYLVTKALNKGTVKKCNV